MPSIIVVPAEKKDKFKVLVNYIQQGIDYSSREMAEREAHKIRSQFDYIKTRQGC